MVCRWVERSFEIAMDKNAGYLDKLLDVYPAEPAKRSFKLCIEQKLRIKELFENIDDTDSAVELIVYLLSFEKFPIKYPYVAFLRALKRKKGDDFLGEYLRHNKSLVDAIRKQLKEKGLEGIYAGIEEPKEANRRMGSLFPQWLRMEFSGRLRVEKKFLDESDSGVYFLEGSDTELLEFARKTLGYSGDKRPDFIAKVVSKNGRVIYVVGEAKFLTDYGGHQNDQLKDALDILNASFSPPKEEEVVPVAVLDGVLWVTSQTIEDIKRALPRVNEAAQQLAKILNKKHVSYDELKSALKDSEKRSRLLNGLIDNMFENLTAEKRKNKMEELERELKKVLDNPKMTLKVLELPCHKVALSALLLNDFLNCLLKEGNVSSCV